MRLLPLGLPEQVEKTPQTHRRGMMKQELVEPEVDVPSPTQEWGFRDFRTHSLFKSINLKDCDSYWKEQH